MAVPHLLLAALELNKKKELYAVVAVVSMSPNDVDPFVEIGATEVAFRTFEPRWKHAIPVQIPSRLARVLIEVYRVDDESLERKELLGKYEPDVDVVFKFPLRAAMIDKKGSKGDYGKICIESRELEPEKHFLTLNVRGTSLPNLDGFLSLSDPYLVFHVQEEDKKWSQRHRTEVVGNTLDPTWKPIRIGLALLCNGDLDKEIIIQCWDKDPGKKSDYIGECKISVQTLLDETVEGRTCSLQLVHETSIPGDHNFSKVENPGQLHFENVSIAKKDV